MSDELRLLAAEYLHDNYFEVEAGFLDPEQAHWSLATLPLSIFHHLMLGGVDGWKQWFDNECQMEEAEDLHRRWRQLLDQPAYDQEHEPVVLLRGAKGYIWDGWHRIGAAIVAGRESISVIVGRPVRELRMAPVESPNP